MDNNDETQPTPTDAPTPTGETPSEDPKAPAKTVPYSRFTEVNEAKKAAEARLAELEAAKKAADEKRLTEEQRWEELARTREQELENLNNQITQERAARQRLLVATEFSLPPELADRLKGNDEAELRADAEKLAALMPKPATPPGVPPTTRGTPGETPKSDAEHLRWLQGSSGFDDIFGGK